MSGAGTGVLGSPDPAPAPGHPDHRACHVAAVSENVHELRVRHRPHDRVNAAGVLGVLLDHDRRTGFRGENGAVDPLDHETDRLLELRLRERRRHAPVRGLDLVRSALALPRPHLVPRDDVGGEERELDRRRHLGMAPEHELEPGRPATAPPLGVSCGLSAVADTGSSRVSWFLCGIEHMFA